MAHVTIEQKDIADLLSTAIDPVYGGSDYWIDEITRVEPTAWTFTDELEYEGEHGHWLHDYPFNEGGALLIRTTDNEVFTLDAAAIESGLDLMAANSPHHFADIIAENADAETADVFLQYCLFKEKGIIYG